MAKYISDKILSILHVIMQYSLMGKLNAFIP